MTSSVTPAPAVGAVGSRPARRLVVWALVGAAVALPATFVGREVLSGSAERDGRAAVASERRATARAYRDKARPILDRGASVVGFGLKPGLHDISTRAYGDQALAGMADDWVNALETVRRDLEAVAAPAPVEGVHWMFVRSLDAYVQTAQALRAAVDATGDDARKRLVDLAASLGRSADQLYDRAEAALDDLDPPGGRR